MFGVRTYTANTIRLMAALGLLVCATLHAAAPAATEADLTIRDFRFATGESLEALKVHYATLGKPRRNARGEIDNAVLVLHGTSGSGKSLLRPIFTDELFGPGQVLDAERYFIIFADSIGHGGSSKPSDGLRTKFPRYDYDDMVRAQHELLVRGLGVKQLRLIIGTSMGCMHAYVWAQTYPEFVEAMVPLACLPVEIAGRNRMWRKAIIELIERDPDWQNGNYREQPKRALATASELLAMVAGAPLEMQQRCGSRESADQCLSEARDRSLATLDANDLLYAIHSSRNYDPSRKLEDIRARVLHINFADDFVNPPELGIAEREIARIPQGTFLLIPASADSRGHGTHTHARVWKEHLEKWLAPGAAPAAAKAE
jgi:homoserine O-acetyltransferase/O-succinyltransferase